MTNDTVIDELQFVEAVQDSYSYLSSNLFLQLRYYARHFLPIFCVVGIVGNCMALVLIRTNYWLKRLTSNIYLCTLSVCGCLFLSTVMGTWLDSTFGFPIYNASVIGCKMLTFIAHSCDFICVWMISWVSCDRMIVLYRPGVRKWVCTKSFARNLVICTVLFSSTLYGWCLVFATVEKADENSSATYCGINSQIEIGGYNFHELHIIFSLLDTVLCTVVPSVVIMLVNSLSIYRYRQCMKIYASGMLRVRFLRVPETECLKHTEETTTAKKLLLSPQSQTTNQPSAVSTRSTRSGKLKSSDLTLSRSLLIVTSTFVLLNVPNYVFRLYESVFDIQSTQLFQFLLFISFLLYYLHHAVLFYMYIFWSPQLKKQLWPSLLRLVECYCCKNVPEFGHHSQVSMNAVRR
uniref:G-protein coupled receptors family 1 profile domain-containing protein n=1 Tax=Acrobeloides nanus TaxID=290746 RepID=A0A914C623_9BILA